MDTTMPTLVYRFVLLFLFFGNPSLASPLETLAQQGRFTLHQHAVAAPPSRTPEDAMLDTYLKYGIEPPEDLYPDYNNFVAEDVAAVGQGSTPALPGPNDQQYLIKAQVGTYNMTLDLDTGSSDLWVVSTSLPAEIRGNRAETRLYNPKSSGANIMNGSSWRIVYGDKSSASGTVYQDKVTIGGLTAPGQAVQAASNISAMFMKDGSKDGFVGLGFARGNTVKPAKQPTWFENVRSKLQKPLFTASLKRHAAGTYDFGYLDTTKYTGNLFYTNVAGKTTHWDFYPSGFSFGGSQIQPARFLAIVDTGTSLWYMPNNISDAYWKQVPGATFGNNRWTFPCDAKLPDVTIAIANGTVTVPGINMNYSRTGGGGMCLGGIQRQLANIGFSIFGDVFMKGLFVVHEAPQGGQARIGFAKAK